MAQGVVLFLGTFFTDLVRLDTVTGDCEEGNEPGGRTVGTRVLRLGSGEPPLLSPEFSARGNLLSGEPLGSPCDLRGHTHFRDE